jgi:hypothetical protein
MKKLIVITIATLLLAACPAGSLEKNARDVAAALGGELQTAQQQLATACQQDATQTPCVAVTRGVNAQNALITSLETYCGWPTAAPPPPVGTVCVPVKSAEGVLTVAITNANQLVSEVKGAIKP